MPKIKTNRVKYPEGWELIEPTLRELQAKMREGLSNFLYHVFVNILVSFHWGLWFWCWFTLLMIVAENDPHDGKRKCETLWPIFKIAHQKSRYIFDLYHRRKEISKELYEFCLDQGYADRNLIAKWKKVCFCLSYVICFSVVITLWPLQSESNVISYISCLFCIG